MQRKLNYRRTFFIGLAFLSISAFWQMYDNIIPLILQNTFHMGETVTGAVMAMDNVLALFLLPLFGAVSDRTDTRFGKRTPYIVAGTAFAAVMLMVLPAADRGLNLPLFLAALFAVLLAMGFYRSPAVALMPDLTPNHLRSKANAVINLMGAVGGIYALIMIKLLVGSGERPDYLPLFVSIAALMVISVGVLVIAVRENRLKKELARELEEAACVPGTSGEALSRNAREEAGGSEGTVEKRTRNVGEEAGGPGRAVEKRTRNVGEKAGGPGRAVEKRTRNVGEKAGGSGRAVEKRTRNVESESGGPGRPVRKPAQAGPAGKAGSESGRQLSPEVRRSMIYMLASIFLWFTAYNAVTTAFSRYTRVVWRMEGGSFANCLMVAMAAAIVSYIPIGVISGRIGRKKTILGGVLLMSACYGAAIFAGGYHPAVNVAFALIGVGWAAINVNSYPMIVAMGQGADIGKFTGTYYTFSMAAQILTPVLSGFLLENVSYRTLFPYALVFSLLAFLTMTQVRHGDVKPLKKSSVLENFDVDD